MTDVGSAGGAVAGADFQERMAVLRRRFVERTRQDGAIVRGLRDRMAAGETLVGDRLKEMQRTVHGLSGAAGVFGFDSISEAAHRVEWRLRGLDQGPGDLDGLLDALEAVLADLWAREAA